MTLINRAGPDHLALETTLLVHGLPPSDAPIVAAELWETVKDEGVEPAVIGVHGGKAVVGMTAVELSDLLEAGSVPKATASNLGLLLHRGSHGATTVSTTVELAAGAGVRVFATGGLGGVHRDAAESFDISSDLGAIARHPVAVVTSGVKSLLNVEGTRELLESLGVPVVGFGTDRFPAFYLRESEAGVDARFDEVEDLARFVGAELKRTGRGIVVAHPVPDDAALDRGQCDAWVAEAMARAQAEGIRGRAVTPFVLAQLHTLSGGATLRANVALVKANARLGAKLVRAMRGGV